ncbi:phytoene/squalene synthase family protein [Rugosimonospora africana]|uniref:Phytoene synthase n=1 Tax=Rugosimonospora africana TaxID=556532 RepID=A0A8J3VPG6_9ACTN|nr:phytoene/squalene synthase family protein [Rugosimonospora africana]GIH13391.1 phytoene synthase [Rugosimonospora africana]
MGASLSASYERCRALHRRHGRTYYLATLLLPRWKRRHVHALYGFTRYADEIVDAFDDSTPERRAARLREWGDRFFSGDLDDPLLPAVLHTIEIFGLDRADFERFLRSMAMDLTVAEYQTYDDLLGYMEGSAAAIGTMMLPILMAGDRPARTQAAGDRLAGTRARDRVTPMRAAGDRPAGTHAAELAREPARQLGLAFQLTNFIRDVGEDLERDRLYLPVEDLDRFGVTVSDLRAAHRAGAATGPIRELIEFEVARAQRHYELAVPGVAMLAPTSQACIRTALLLYRGILDEIAAVGHDVLAKRARVPLPRRLSVAAGSLLTPPGHPVPSASV